MHIFLEGADCVGKTTFSYQLTSLLGHKYIHQGPLPHDWTFDDYIDRLARTPTVFDRFFLSEEVYAMRKKIPLSVSNRDKSRLIQLMAATGIQIVMTATDDTLARRYNAARELYTLEQIQQDNKMFLEKSAAPQWHSMPTLYLGSEFAREDTEDAVNLVLEFTEGVLRRASNGVFGALSSERKATRNCGKSCSKPCDA